MIDISGNIHRHILHRNNIIGIQYHKLEGNFGNICVVWWEWMNFQSILSKTLGTAVTRRIF